jgi:anaerobic ribonucleoside-triphosphate reductase
MKEGRTIRDRTMLRVYTGEVLALVENMKNVLKMHDIESYIKNQYLSAAIGEIPPQESWPQLWVSDQDFEHARKIIEDAEKDPPESQEILICSKCGEEVEGQFARCWNCGAEMN